MSRQVLVPFLITAGVVGLPLLVGLSRCNSREEGPEAPAVSENQNYTHNSYLAGAGYYHAPFHGWFPYPFNHFDASRGYFRGGQWHTNREDETKAPGTVNGVAGTAHHSGFVSSSRPSPEAVKRANSATSQHRSPTIKRGGFGSSSHFTSS